ncbi:MAG: glycosyltransferase family 4 protein [Archaeoglobaceae archaeon]
MDDVGIGNSLRGAKRMKILMVGPFEEIGGVATHTRYLFGKIRDLGHDVEVYSTSPKRRYPSVISKFIKLYKKTIGLGIKLILRGNKYDIVHVQASGPIGGFLPAIVAAMLRKIVKLRLVVTFHYSNYEMFIRKRKRLVKFVLGSSDIFITVSKGQSSIIKNIVKNELLLNKVLVVPNGFDSSKLPFIEKSLAKQKLGITNDNKIIFNLANLLEKKGHKYLIEAMKIVSNKRKDVICYIGGEGPLKKKLEDQIKKLNLQEHVKLLGFIPDEELYLWMNAADIFVLPSLSEGNPTVMFEALGVGLPFVGTAVGGVPEIITSEDYGLLCKPGDAEDLAEKILIALEKEWDREKIRKYAEQFTWDNIAKQVVRVYEEVLNER